MFSFLYFLFFILASQRAAKQRQSTNPNAAATNARFGMSLQVLLYCFDLNCLFNLCSP